MKFPFAHSPSPATDSPAQPESRKYYEAWGDALENVQFFKRLTMALIFLNILALILLNKSLRRPPVIIRVDDVGKAEPIRDLNADAKLTKPEVLNFTQLFMKYFLERNFYTWKENVAEAEKMMTPRFRGNFLKTGNLGVEARSIEANKLTSKLSFSTIDISRETADYLIVGLKGYRQITSYIDPHFMKETIFEGEMALKKVPRTMETPYGLQVDSYKETEFKDDKI
jgi:hypothetical protein